jgi:hypothetical protein
MVAPPCIHMCEMLFLLLHFAETLTYPDCTKSHLQHSLRTFSELKSYLLNQCFKLWFDHLQDENSQGDFVGMISRQNMAALLAQHGKDAEAIDLSAKVEVRGTLLLYDSVCLH